MDKSKRKLFSRKLLLSLFFIPCTLIFHTGIGITETMPIDAGNTNIALEEQFIDFTDGIVEHIGGGMISVRKAEYFFSGETKVVTMTGDEISRDSIQKGDYVRITYLSMHNNMVLEIELQEKAVEIEKQFLLPEPDRVKKNNVIIYEDGVFRN